MSLKTEAQNYEPPKPKSIADLERVSVDVEIMEDEGTDKDGNVFSYKYIEDNGIRYRVPGVVLGAIKKLLEKQPRTKYIQVSKEGEGLQTRYFVFPAPVLKSLYPHRYELVYELTIALQFCEFSKGI